MKMHLTVGGCLLAVALSIHGIAGAGALEDEIQAAIQRDDAKALRELILSRPSLTVNQLLYQAAIGGKVNAAELLIEERGDVEQEINGSSLLCHVLVRDVRAEMVLLLLQAGARADVRCGSGKHSLPILPMTLDRTRTDVDLIALSLINAGADVNDADNEGWTPLLRAVTARRPRIVQALLEKGADTKPEKGGRTALGFARASNQTEIVRLLEEAGAR
jgi:ankyrin repeat domain-containing protein 17